MATDPTQQGMFRKLANSERKRLVNSLGAHRTALIVRGKNEEIFNMTSERAEGERFLEAKPARGAPAPKEDQDVMVNFSLGIERYFFQGRLDLDAGKFYLSTEADFYILQRRKAARLVMPEEFPSGFNIIQYQARKTFYSMKIIDFSSGGLKVYYPSLEPTFINGETIKGVIHLGVRRPLEMDGFVRHVVRETEGEKKGQVFGVQFDPGNKIMEVKLLTMFMDLQREIYLKYTK